MDRQSVHNIYRNKGVLFTYHYMVQDMTLQTEDLSLSLICSSFFVVYPRATVDQSSRFLFFQYLNFSLIFMDNTSLGFRVGDFWGLLKYIVV